MPSTRWARPRFTKLRCTSMNLWPSHCSDTAQMRPSLTTRESVPWTRRPPAPPCMPSSSHRRRQSSLTPLLLRTRLRSEPRPCRRPCVTQRPVPARRCLTRRRVRRIPPQPGQAPPRAMPTATTPAPPRNAASRLSPSNACKAMLAALQSAFGRGTPAGKDLCGVSQHPCTYTLTHTVIDSLIV